MFEAALKSRISAHFAPVPITFPISEDQYEQVLLTLEKSQIGEAGVQDCVVENVRAPNSPALVRMTGTTANIDKLDWLGKQLESFDRHELLQFCAAAERFDISSVDKLMNLPFCSREVTVVSDFNDLERIGKRHYFTFWRQFLFWRWPHVRQRPSLTRPRRTFSRSGTFYQSASEGIRKNGS